MTTEGGASGPGSSETDAWSLAHAFDNAEAGDVVCVKSGNYGNLHATQTNNGSAENKITFLGYQTIPGDVVSQEGRSTFDMSGNVDAEAMPLLHGDNAETALALNIVGDNVTLINFQFTEYLHALVVQGSSVTIENGIFTNLQVQDVDVTGGKAIRVGADADDVHIHRCAIRNAGSEGITIHSDRALVTKCDIRGDNPINPMGYYYLFAGGAEGGVMDDCTVYREVGLSHSGHGFDMKDSATNNTVRNSQVTGTNLEVNFSGVHDNLFENIDIQGPPANPDTWHNGWQTTIRVKNGAHHNTFRNIRMRDVFSVVRFRDDDDGYSAPDADRDETETGSHNRFFNLDVQRANYVFYTTTTSGEDVTGPAESNYFYNSTFVEVERIVSANADVDDLRFINTIVHGVSDQLFYVAAGVSYAGSYETSSISGWEGSVPSGFLTIPPSFVDRASGDFRLNADSGLINMGVDTDYAFDFDGTPRPAGSFDIGAYER